MSKEDRQAIIRELVAGKKVKTQNELVEALKNIGLDVTQATVSRDINEMGYVRDQLGYKSAEEKVLEDVFRWVKDIKISGNLIVILTEPGAAQTVGLALDKVDIEGVLGSVAGDDTIFLAVEENKATSTKNQLDALKERTER